MSDDGSSSRDYYAYNRWGTAQGEAWRLFLGVGIVLGIITLGLALLLIVPLALAIGVFATTLTTLSLALMEWRGVTTNNVFVRLPPTQTPTYRWNRILT